MADEEQAPLLGREARDENQHGSSGTTRGAVQIRLDAKHSVDDPERWPPACKWTIVAILSLMAFNVSFTCSSILPTAAHIVAELGGGKASRATGVLLVTVWEVGEAAGPLLLAPLSEVYGRRAAAAAANAGFALAAAATALSPSTPLLVAARLLTGLTVASNVLGPAVVGDMLRPARRGSAMTVVMAATLVGGAAGPAVGGAGAEAFGWRRVVWLSVALAAACQVLVAARLRETYRVGGRGDAAAASASAAAASAGGEAELAGGESVPRLRCLWPSLARPAQVLYHSGVLAALCLFHGVAFSYYYIVAVTLPDILHGVYGQSPTETGLSFVYFTAGTGIGVVLCILGIDRVYERLRGLNGGAGRPEFYLPLALGGALGQPAAVMLYGCVAHARLPLPCFLAALVALGVSLLLSTLPVFAYVVDAFGPYSASAVAAVIVTRCVMGAFIPLLVWPLVGAVGLGWGFAALGAAGLCLAPVPVLLLMRGCAWRQRSKYTRSL